ncbi:S8 family peptidase [Algoriphagus halophilus]|uniref:Subtilase family protein n=1 Tax=Algoriphagus halophilus TaxID=226505 RepID=A0A1N6GIN1_9BACT|nr:S8 family peptidase [Algoriphagus halophilus]SIO07379.1 Subtilase family protein [Algoriphagus halophilus]
MIRSKIQLLAGLGVGLMVMGCSSSSLITAPPISYTNTSPKVAELTDQESRHWGHLDLQQDTIPGMSIDRAYAELLKKKKGEEVIVAVIDSGIDLDHEDIQEVLWTNPGEKPGDGLDNDGNGYIDDIHGYNFLGESFNEQMEMARIVRLKLGDEAYQAAAQEKINEKLPEARAALPQLKQIEALVTLADKNIKTALGKEYYSLADLQGYEPKNVQEERTVGMLMQVISMGENIPDAIEELQAGINYYETMVNYNLNVDFNGRTPVGDDPYDYSDQDYGNGDPNIRDTEESHGSHVAGIIAATRNNKKGVDGVANRVKIMSVRAVPNGDEYDKDIALAIRYAADNGAKVINASFGKGFSPNSEWVYDALAYAASKDVLFVHAAGNDGIDLDDPKNPSFPNDHPNGAQSEFEDNYLTVGALTPMLGSEMVAVFSNYGKKYVDIFAPGQEILSTMPNNGYEFQDGTSMAAPAVTGLAAMIRSYYPSLSAAQVKQVILESGIALDIEVMVGGPEGEEKPFSEISSSGKIANLYNALILASQVANGKASL